MKLADRTYLFQKESPDATLAKNLVAARIAAGLTQRELSVAANVSRATIAQLETGSSDPRLSTIVDLAGAMGITPMLLLIGPVETRALADLPRRLAENPLSMKATDVAHMRRYLKSGMLKDRVRAARLGARIARQALETDQNSRPGTSAAVWISAAVLSAILPGEGTAIGAAMGHLLIEQEKTSSRAESAPRLNT